MKNLKVHQNLQSTKFSPFQLRIFGEKEILINDFIID